MNLWSEAEAKDLDKRGLFFWYYPTRTATGLRWIKYTVIGYDIPRHLSMKSDAYYLDGYWTENGGRRYHLMRIAGNEEDMKALLTQLLQDPNPSSIQLVLDQAWSVDDLGSLDLQAFVNQELLKLKITKSGQLEEEI